MSGPRTPHFTEFLTFDSISTSDDESDVLKNSNKYYQKISTKSCQKKTLYPPSCATEIITIAKGNHACHNSSVYIVYILQICTRVSVTKALNGGKPLCQSESRPVVIHTNGCDMSIQYRTYLLNSLSTETL